MFGFSQIQLIAAIGLAVLLGVLFWRVHYLEGENDALHESIGKYQGVVAELQRTIQTKDRDIEAQNKALEAFEMEGRGRAQAAAKALQEASKRAADSERRAQELLSKIPGSNDVCKETDLLFNDYLKQRNATNVNPTSPTGFLRLDSGRMLLSSSAHSQNRR